MTAVAARADMELDSLVELRVCGLLDQGNCIVHIIKCCAVDELRRLRISLSVLHRLISS